MSAINIAQPYLVEWHYTSWTSEIEQELTEWMEGNLTGKCFMYGSRCGYAYSVELSDPISRKAANHNSSATVLMLFEEVRDAMLFKLTFGSTAN